MAGPIETGNRSDYRSLLSYLFTRSGARSAAGPQINVILNWFEELKQRVPTGAR